MFFNLKLRSKLIFIFLASCESFKIMQKIINYQKGNILIRDNWPDSFDLKNDNNLVA